MTTPSAGYSLPRSSDEFERLVLRLLRRHWQLPQLERFHDPERRERAIHLLEVSGRPRPAAVRCELRDPAAPLSAAEIKDAADRAASMKLPIGRFVVVTSASRPSGLQRILYDLNRGNRSGVSSIEVLSWEEIEELLDEYPHILSEFNTAAKPQALTRSDAAVHFEPRCDSALEIDGARDPIGDEIAAANADIDARRHQLARLRLLRLREQRWAELPSEHKFRVLTTLAAAWLKEGERRRAAMLFIAAKSLRPDEENACTNEALAHELLGERERAYALADRLMMQFPSSGRALALWLNNAPRRFNAGALEQGIAPELRADPEVSIVMSRRALAEGDYERAERYGRGASTAMPNRSLPWLVLGQATLLSEITPGKRHESEEADADVRIREAEGYFTQAISLAQAENSAANEVQGLMGRAQARIALRDAEGAGRDIEDAHGLEREDANGLCEYGIVLRTRGSLNEAIEVFRRAAAVGGRDDVEYHLAVTLRERDEPGDLQEATELLMHALAHPESIPEDDYPFALGCTVDALASLERWHEADAITAAAPADRISKLALLTLRANLRIAEAKYDQASKLADEALAELSPDVSAESRRRLAALLHDLGRYRDALPLWQALAPAGTVGTDTRRLLDCANRLGREDIALEIARAIRPADLPDSTSFPARLKKLEKSDPEAALTALEEYLNEHPDDRVMRLRRSIIAARLGRSDLIASDPNALPSAREVPPELGRDAVRIMREGGRANEALTYAYELIRIRSSDIDAHRAYLAALGPIGPMPHVLDFDSAAPGAAVCFVEQDQNTDRWIILEDANDPDESREEYGPSHPLAKALKGKRAGEKFQLPEGRFSRKSAVVKSVISKFAHRYQDCLFNLQARFPGQPEIEVTDAAAEVIAWSEIGGDFADIFDAASQARSNGSGNDNGSGNGKPHDAMRLIESVYAHNPIPLHAISERISLNDLQTVFTLAQRPEAQIKCCTGSAEELDAALAAFDRANAVVLDLTAIATLCLLGRLNLIATWPRQFVISQSTLSELRRLAFEDTLMKLPPGFCASMSQNGGESKRCDVQLKGLADAIQSVCRVRDGAALAVIDGERRDQMIRLFGRGGAESIVLASMPGHVLWSDDRILADFAKTQFGVRRVWTHAALQARTLAGNLDPNDLATAATKLAGWGYTLMAPTVDALMRAGAVAMWNPEQFPLKQALDQFASESIDLADAVRLAAEIVVRLYSDVHLRGSRRTVTTRLIDRIAERSGGRDAVEALPRSLPIRFGLDLIRARELSDVVRGWMAQQGEAQLSASAR